MEITSILYQFIFMPLQLLFEEIYYIIGWKLTKNPGLSIIVLSLTVNLLVLPLYNRADAVQEAERAIDAKLRKGVEHIKKTFKGDEQLMMLQTYYRQNNYSPFDAIKGSISLFLEIPFFVAAYQFLSNLSVLQGASLGPIKDLSQPDGLLQLAGMTVNVMPLIMTAVNIAATALFVTNMPTKTKVQLYGLAFFFFIFLYKSPSGLVFYWTLNNLFNLVKTAVYKFRGVPTVNIESSNMVVPDTSKGIMAKIRKLTGTSGITAAPEGKQFLAGAAFLAILTGLLIPSSVIGASPQEFIIGNYVENPLWFVVSAFALAAGAFVLWLGVFYWLADAQAKLKYECFVASFSITGIVTYMVWGKNSGLLSDMLVLSNGLANTHKDKIINGIFIVAVGWIMHFFWRKYRKYCFEALVIGCVAMVGMGIMNIMAIKEAMAKVGSGKVGSENINDTKLVLSKTGKNVIVFMLDCAQGAQVPYILNEKPELKQAFDGFTYYDNVISYGSHTLFGSPSIFGGYEYVPEAMQKRSDRLLRVKHNEAMLLLPVLFQKAGYESTVANLPLLNYSWISDYSAFKDYPEIKIGNFANPSKSIESAEELEDRVAKNKRNFFCYSLFKISPVLIHGNLYANGRYNRFDKVKDQSVHGLYRANAVKKSFMSSYQAMEELKEKTKIIEDGNTFLSMTSDITHESAMLQMPNYLPAGNVDNSKFIDYNGDNYVINGRRLAMNNSGQVTNYHCNMAAFLKLADWFNYLRDQGVYDNSRIFLVSDHGAGSNQIEDLKFNNGDAMSYFPLLMVKDFGSKGFEFNSQFMTNADVPALAVKDIIENPINPFTSKRISMDDKAREQFIIESSAYEFRYNTGEQFQSARWYGVKNNIWDKNNWRLAKEDSKMPY